MISRNRRSPKQTASGTLGQHLPLRGALGGLASAFLATLGIVTDRLALRRLEAAGYGRMLIAGGSVAAATLASVALVVPSAAQACSQEENQHCYSIIRSRHEFEGTWVDILTSADNVTGWNKGDFVQNETWASFSGGGWVEVGDTTGLVDWGHTQTPVYFYAGEYPAGGQHYYEGAFSTGPSIGQWFWVQEQDEGNGTWCVWINGGETQCVSGRPLFTSAVEAGLEAAVDYPVTNDGTAFAWAMNKGTGAWSSWAPESYEWTGNYCVYGVPWEPNSGLGDPGGSGLTASGMVFSTPTSNPYCKKRGSVLTAPLAGVGGVATTTEMAKPVAAGYTPASSSTLSSLQLHAIAQGVAKNAGDEEAASGTVQAVAVPLKTAMTAIEPTTSFPSSVETGYANLLQSSTELVVMHGHFKLATAHVPHGVAAPTGTVLEVVIDTHTGWVDGLGLGESAATDLSQLGPVENLSGGA